MTNEYEIRLPITGAKFTQPVMPEQRRRFGLAVCERLGLDPAIIGEQFDWKVMGDEELGQITFTVFLPGDEILAMWNGAAL